MALSQPNASHPSRSALGACWAVACVLSLLGLGACVDSVPEQSPRTRLQPAREASSSPMTSTDKPEADAGGGRCQSGAACDLKPVCGDGTRVSSEQCDDGNRTSGDGCDSSCSAEPRMGCGDGEKVAGEECDDGNRVDTDACSNACLQNVCGNGRIDVNEECDDGNTADQDGCSSKCQEVRCRNGRVEAGEECDDGDDRDDNGCTNQCQKMLCGNGMVEAKEECDDGNTNDGDTCSSRCLSIKCGNKRVDSGEECDGDDRCDQTCHKIRDLCRECQEKHCRKGYPDESAAIDWYGACVNDVWVVNDDVTMPIGAVNHAYPPGAFPKLCLAVVDCALRNKCVAEDGQSTACYCGTATIDECFGAAGPKAGPCEAEIVAASEADKSDRAQISVRFTDTGYPLGYANYLITCGHDRCSSECTPYLPVVPWCGNGKVEMGEACDDGNAVDTDACSNTCIKKP